MGSRRPWAALGPCLLAISASDATARVDTASWVGASYTPAGAPGNSLWWHWFEDYEASVARELNAARRMLGLTAVRIFLHSMVYSADPPRLLGNFDRFLEIAAGSGIRVGVVFFGDCFNHNGASLKRQCVPVKGRHNGCWMASPQDAERTDVERFRPYVTEVVARFRADARVLWWEIFNEPRSDSAFSLRLRQAGYGWAKALSPTQPVLSCWDDNAATDIVDHHEYSTTFKTTWSEAIFSNVSKGAIVTEGGSRWYQPPHSEDAGSPLTVINFLEALRRDPASPFVPGAMICWAVMVGNDNTRWHWGTGDGEREPLIPWDAWLFPDGTPVSHTEAAALRRYVSGSDEFLFFEDFLLREVVDGDSFLTLQASQQWHAPVMVGGGLLGNALVETSFWAEQFTAAFSLVLRSQNRTVPTLLRAQPLDGYQVVVQNSQLSVRRQQGDSTLELSTFNLSTLENGFVCGAWNMLRVLAVDGSIDVWFNPMYQETGFEGTAEDSHKVPRALPTRISVLDPEPLAPGGLAILAGSSPVRVDYISALPPGVVDLARGSLDLSFV